MKNTLKIDKLRWNNFFTPIWLSLL